MEGLSLFFVIFVSLNSTFSSEIGQQVDGISKKSQGVERHLLLKGEHCLIRIILHEVINQNINYHNNDDALSSENGFDKGQTLCRW